MCDFVRSLPDPVMIVAMMVFGAILIWILLLAIRIVRRLQYVLPVRYAKLKRENYKLKRKVAQLQEVKRYV